MSQAVDRRTAKEHGEQAASATYAMGDLHGEVTLLRQLLGQLAPRREDTPIFLGETISI